MQEGLGLERELSIGMRIEVRKGYLDWSSSLGAQFEEWNYGLLFESRLLPGSLLILGQFISPKLSLPVTILKFGRIHLITLTVTVLAFAVTPFISIGSQLPS